MPTLTMQQVQSAMKAMMDKAMETPNEPVAMAIVDSTGNLEAYATMDNLRLFSRRHAIRKAYTSAIMGLNSGGKRPTAAWPGAQHQRAGRLQPYPRPRRPRGNEGRRDPGWHRRRRLPQRAGRRGPVAGRT